MPRIRSRRRKIPSLWTLVRKLEEEEERRIDAAIKRRMRMLERENEAIKKKTEAMKKEIEDRKVTDAVMKRNDVLERENEALKAQLAKSQQRNVTAKSRKVRRRRRGHATRLRKRHMSPNPTKKIH